MCRPALDMYDIRPQSMTMYLSNWGWHMNKPLCEYAISLMKKEVNGKKESITPKKKEEVESLFTKYGIKLESKFCYDHLFVFHMAMADYCSFMDERMMCLFTKAYCEDVDAADGVVMRRWYATMVGNGDPIYWSDFLNDTE